jgi:xanthine dehydrogenase accessory factor
LHIIGGGHCSLALSKLMSQMDFYIIIYEDRKDLPTLRKNIYAHKHVLVNDYSELNTFIHPGDNQFAVIMTFGYRTDDIAFRALKDKEFTYLGILGSKSKIDKMKSDWLKEGIDFSKIKNLKAPVGMQIKSQTPEEIAVSIAAEIIFEKNRILQ